MRHTTEQAIKHRREYSCAVIDRPNKERIKHKDGKDDKSALDGAKRGRRRDESVRQIGVKAERLDYPAARKSVIRLMTRNYVQRKYRCLGTRHFPRFFSRRTLSR